ncbi:hypothetical protein A2U01_0091889, partial [Trifolium medium]|nr:hypothetical protein [Trifolium medium]
NEEDTDEISTVERPLGRTFFQRAVMDLQAAQAAAAAPQPPPQPAAASGSTSHPPAAPLFRF